ncbi:hypothetical protein [Paenibacillus thiaminolyticus]|uniref:Uncharacterized protein n=1 Tax=Paenibacillus thiaminolyticus TaxID=49283 RepID=A0A3A3GY59_PANTH|nr:hypothetical protein [Paenibacillus thiaminolyticus]RJG23111.1 hypothetical protein DQX05_14650 [Paenibacillus thiaminolyticus]
MLDEIGAHPDRMEHCLLGYDPNNEAARRLYASAGFVETGISPWGEMMAKYDFPGRLLDMQRPSKTNTEEAGR